jgi:hypothetical protein
MGTQVQITHQGVRNQCQEDFPRAQSLKPRGRSLIRKGKRKDYKLSKSQSDSLNEQLIPTNQSKPGILSISDFTNLVRSLPANDFAHEDSESKAVEEAADFRENKKNN